MAILNTKQEEVFGGQQWIRIAPVEAFSSITYDYQNKITAVAFNGGYAWQEMYNTFETIIFTEEQTTTILGDGWRQEVVGFIPGKNDSLDITFEQMTKQRWIVAVNDWDNRLTVVGTIANGCRFKFKYDSKSKVANLKGLSVAFFRDDISHTRSIAKSVLF